MCEVIFTPSEKLEGLSFLVTPVCGMPGAADIWLLVCTCAVEIFLSRLRIFFQNSPQALLIYVSGQKCEKSRFLPGHALWGMHTLEQTKGDPQKVDRALRCCWFLSCKGNIGARARSDFHLSYQEMRIFR